MRINQRLEKLEMAASPVENTADAIRRAIREMREGTDVRPPYIPGQSAILDAIHKRRIERGETL